MNNRSSLANFPSPLHKESDAEMCDWKEEFEKQLLSELSVKINPAYAVWGTLEDKAKVSVYLRVLGITKKQAWKRIKDLGFDKFDRPYY